MPSTFEVAVEVILRWEGGDTNRADDPGGLTRFGIAQTKHPELDVTTLTRDQAIAIYKEEYWDALGLDALPPSIALLVFDCAVNQGTGRAGILLQKALGFVGRDLDGKIGTVTRSAVWGANLVELRREFSARRAYAYGTLESFGVFGFGWMRRLLDLHDRAGTFR